MAVAEEKYHLNSLSLIYMHCMVKLLWGIEIQVLSSPVINANMSVVSVIIISTMSSFK